ncbi:MAG: N-acetyltransferase family protein, partial [Planctomycetota bacterium]
RAAEARDASGIAEILNWELVHGVAHFGEVPEPPDEVERQFHAEAHKYPWLVAVDFASDDVIGIARARPSKTRHGYDWTAEVSVYVRRDRLGKGVGRALYAALFPELERRGFRCLIAGMTLPNPASKALHESFGMRSIGVFPKVGHKHGVWRDVEYFSVHLGEGPPRPDGGVRPFRDS